LRTAARSSSSQSTPWWPPAAGARTGWRAVRRARHRPQPRHRGHRRARGGPQRGHGGGQRRALRIQAHRLSRPLQEQGAHLLPEPRRLVAQENYDNDLAVVNGHSYKDKKSENTNVAILCSHNFSIPFNQPIAYAQKVGELTNMLGDGPHPGAALRRHSGRQAHLAAGAGLQSNVKPTCRTPWRATSPPPCRTEP
jgi:hypothetical protein